MLSVNFLGLRSVIFTTCDSFAAISFHATSLCLWNMEPVDYSPSSFSFICIILLIWKPEEISCHKNHLKNERLSAKTSVISLYLSYRVNIVDSNHSSTRYFKPQKFNIFNSLSNTYFKQFFTRTWKHKHKRQTGGMDFLALPKFLG